MLELVNHCFPLLWLEACEEVAVRSTQNILCHVYVQLLGCTLGTKRFNQWRFRDLQELVVAAGVAEIMK